ncbi:hypothetical protein EC973_005178 [Apophysomyces ossiformis]|uniref:Uncharacterized protein n=1 Tax=Apophysomyces ossiformis TaxID=679940 RepID=A0A8H7BZ29_9FUNG|nr:hypothetical protein EC973_005178 [Apophysomyces ossiformis]
MTTAVNQSAKAKPDGGATADILPQDVGLIFVREYYTFLSKKPERIHGFYNKDSQFVRGIEGTPTESCIGSQAIRDKIDELGYEDCKIRVTQVDSQGSASNGILVQVLGEMCSRDEPAQRFCQTFFLAPQPNGYYVLNDIFRFLKDEDLIDTEDEEVEQQQQFVKSEQELSSEVKEEEAVELVPEDATQPSETKDITPVTVEPTIPTEDETAAATTAAAEVEKEAKVESDVEEEGWGTVAVNGVAEYPSTQAANGEEDRSIENQQAQSEPKTWAKLAANASEKWSVQAAEAKAAVTPTTPVQSKTAAAQPVRTGESQPRQQQTQINKEQRKEEMTEIFIKNVLPSLTEEQVREAFSQFGEIKSLNILTAKKCAILEYTSTEAVQKALSQRKVEVGEVVTSAEERHYVKKRPFARQQYNGIPAEARRTEGNRRRGGGGGGPRGGGGHRYRSGGGPGHSGEQK